MLVRTFSGQCWFSCCYVVAVAVDDVNVVVVVRVRGRVILAFFVVCGVGIVGDVVDIVQ